MKLTKRTGVSSDLKPGHWMIPPNEAHPRVIGAVQLVMDDNQQDKTQVKFDFYKGMRKHLYSPDDTVTYYKLTL